MVALTKEAILSLDDCKPHLVPVPEWGGDVYVRVMTGVEREKYEEWAESSNKSVKGIRGRLASLCIVDESGKRLFDDADIEALNGKSAAALDRVLTAVMKLNAVSAADVKQLAGN